MKNEITQEEYDILTSQFEKLEKRHQFLRQAHIDANNEGDQRECDAWFLTDKLSKQNVARMKEIDDFLLSARVVSRKESDVVDCGSRVRLNMGGNEKEVVFCYPIMLKFLDNGISEFSKVGRAIKGKKRGFATEVELENGEVLEVRILDVF